MNLGNEFSIYKEQKKSSGKYVVSKRETGMRLWEVDRDQMKEAVVGHVNG